MLNYSLLVDIQSKPLDVQIEILRSLYFEALSLKPSLKEYEGPENEAIRYLTAVMSDNKKWLSITQIKDIVGNDNLSNTRLGLALKKHKIPKRRGKIKGDKVNVHSLYFI